MSDDLVANSTLDLQTIQIGSLSLLIGKLTLGQLRRDDALLEAVNNLQQLSSLKGAAGERRMPTQAQFSTMVKVVAAAALPHNDGITAEAIEQALDEEPYDTGFVILAQAVAVATYGRKIRSTGGLESGEAVSPSSSTSSDSTGSSPQLSAIELSR